MLGGGASAEEDVAMVLVCRWCKWWERQRNWRLDALTHALYSPCIRLWRQKSHVTVMDFILLSLLSNSKQGDSYGTHRWLCMISSRRIRHFVNSLHIQTRFLLVMHLWFPKILLCFLEQASKKRSGPSSTCGGMLHLCLNYKFSNMQMDLFLVCRKHTWKTALLKPM